MSKETSDLSSTAPSHAQFWGEHPRDDHRPQWHVRRLGLRFPESTPKYLRRCEVCGWTEMKVAWYRWTPGCKVFGALDA